nr:hypothetical protein C5167_032932 [Ipomoea batatas]
MQGCFDHGYMGPLHHQALCSQIRCRCCLHCATSGPDYNGQTSWWSKERSICSRSNGRGLSFASLFIILYLGCASSSLLSRVLFFFLAFNLL